MSPAEKRIVVKGKGVNLPFPAAFDVAPGLVVQLRRQDATDCWESTYSSATSNQPDLVKARSD